MADIFNKKTRRRVMSLIRSKNTHIELLLKRALVAAGIPFRFQPKMPGRPDFLISSKIVIFCDSSFWHGRNWVKLKKKLINGKNPEYWVKHIANNRRRDREVNRILKSLGYAVLRFWDDDLNNRTDMCLRLVRQAMSNDITGNKPPKS